MADVTQIPGTLNIKIAQGNKMSFLVDFDIDLTGYTFESKVVETDGTLTAITVTETNLATGQITISLTAAQTTALEVTPDTIPHSWYLDKTNVGTEIRYLAGNFEVITVP